MAPDNYFKFSSPEIADAFLAAESFLYSETQLDPKAFDTLATSKCSNASVIAFLEAHSKNPTTENKIGLIGISQLLNFNKSFNTEAELAGLTAMLAMCSPLGPNNARIYQAAAFALCSQYKLSTTKLAEVITRQLFNLLARRTLAASIKHVTGMDRF